MTFCQRCHFSQQRSAVIPDSLMHQKQPAALYSLITTWQAQHFISVKYVIYTLPSSLHTQAYQYEQEASLAVRQALLECYFLPLFVCN